MKLIAELEAEGGATLRLSCDGERLTVGDVCVALAEFREALDAVAPKAKAAQFAAMPKPSGGMTAQTPLPAGWRYETGLYGPHDHGVGRAENIFARNPDGSRRGPSPRDGMRSRPAPEANVEDEESAT